MDAKAPSPAIEKLEDANSVTKHGGQELGAHTTGDVLLVTATNHVRRIPVPTNDPNDPLNFNKWRKLGIVVTCCWFSIFSILSLSGTGTFMNTLYQMYGADHSPEDITGLSTYPTMVMAFGCLGLLPLSFVIGRRPVFLLAVVIAFICNLTAGGSKDFQGHFVSRIFVGLATGATESILPLILSDITFLNERSFFFGLYWSVQNGVSSSILIGLSYLVAATSWRWYYWLFGITLGVSALLVVFLSPETKFFRSPTSLDGQVVYTDEFGTTHVVSDEEARERWGNVQEHVAVTSEKRTFVQELKPWSDVTPNGLQVLLSAYIKILQALTSPGVIYALMCASIALGIGIAITLVYSTILVESYHWSASSVGLFNAGVIPASLFAMFYAGYCADKVNLWLARRNGGIHTPEHHLVHLIFPCLMGVCGIVVIAVCSSHPEKYSAWGLVVGWAIYQFSFTCVLITTTTFAAEVIPENPGAAIVAVVGGKNIVSFGASYGIVPMVSKYSYMKAFMILMGIYIAIFALGLPVFFLNHKWRKAISHRR